MKQLDWKSFAIGVLLTTTVMLGTAAATSTTEKWDADQKWDIKVTSAGHPHTKNNSVEEMTLAGYEPFQTVFGPGYKGPDLFKSYERTVEQVFVLWRKRIQ